MNFDMTSVFVSAMVGVLIGSAVKGEFGGTRSSIGIHGSNGKLLPFHIGIIFFALVSFAAAFFSTMVSTFLTDVFSGLGAIIVAMVGVSFYLWATSYSR